MNAAGLVFDIERDEKGRLYVKNAAGYVTAWLKARIDADGNEYVAMVVPLDLDTYYVRGGEVDE